jgi:hypothetical protein
MKKVILAAMIAAALTGCGTTSLVEKKADWVQGSDKVDLTMAPEWFTMHLANDGSHIFATATEYSADYQFAVDKAMLAAKAQLASQVNNRIKMDTDTFIAEEGNGTDIDDVERKTQRTTSSKVDSTLIVGFKRDKIEVRREGRGYRVFVRLVYDYTDNNKLVQQAQRIEKRKEKAAEKKAQFERNRLDNMTPTVVTPIPEESKTLSQRANELPHNTISDPVVKKRVEDAIARGDAVIISKTIQ